MPKVRALCSASITQPRRSYDPVRLPSWPLPYATLRTLPSPLTGPPRLLEPPFRRAVPTTPADRAGARVDCFPRSLEPSPSGRWRHPHCHFRGLHRLHSVTARRIAQPPKVTFVMLQPSQLPDQAARQLPDLSTIIRVESSSTGVSRLRGALPTADITICVMAARREAGTTHPLAVRHRSLPVWSTDWLAASANRSSPSRLFGIR